MAPELLNTIDANELKALAQRIREFQEPKGLSDNGLLKLFSAMGSTTTYKKILNGKLEELDLDRQLTNYRAVVALMDATKDAEEEEEYFDDLLGAIDLRRSFMETSRSMSIARFILVQGDTGTGKTACAKLLIKKFGGRFIWIEASEAWGDSPNALLAAILRARGVKELPTAMDARMELVVTTLNATRTGTIIDEGHHMGPRCLNIIKTLINRTPDVFIVCAMKTLWTRLERDAYQEVKQLTGNRLSERIRLELRTDVKKLLDRRLALNGDTKQAVALIMQYAPARANLAFLREVCRRARIQAEDEPVTMEIFTNAVTAEVNGR